MSRNEYTREGLVIASLERAPSSVNGNPAWFVTFTDGTTARTSADASWSYGAENPEYRDVPLRVTFTRAGRIVFAEVMS